MSVRPNRLDVLSNEYHYGASGTGKSRGVRDRFPDAYIKPNNIWWDGYNGEETVIIEEFGPNQISICLLKQWCDHYSFQAQLKGSMILIRP